MAKDHTMYDRILSSITNGHRHHRIYQEKTTGTFVQTSKITQIGNSSFAAADWLVRVSATVIGYIESRTFAR